MVLTKNAKTIDAFSSHVITTKASTANTGERINVMTQALHVEDSSLPQGLMVQNVYTELRKDSKNVIIVVRNSMAYPQTLKKKTPVAKAVKIGTNRLNRGNGRGWQPSNTQVNCVAKTREIVQGIGPEQIGIEVT